MRFSRRSFAAVAFVLCAACGMGGGGGGSSTGGGGGGSGGGGGGGGTSGSTADQLHNLDKVNQYRAMVGAAPLVIDPVLDSFAQQGSVELSQDHTPHKHFADASSAGTLFVTDGFVGSAGENQGDPNGWPIAGSVAATIDQILLAMWNEGPGTGAAHGHYNNMVDPAFHRLGVGLFVVGGDLYMTNDFSQ